MGWSLYVWEADNGREWYTIAWQIAPNRDVALVLRHQDLAERVRYVAEAHRARTGHPVRLMCYEAVELIE